MDIFTQIQIFKKVAQTMESAGDTLVTYFSDNMNPARKALGAEVSKKISAGELGENVSSVSVQPFINAQKKFGVDAQVNGVNNPNLSGFCMKYLGNQGIQAKIDSGSIILSKEPAKNKFVWFSFS